MVQVPGFEPASLPTSNTRSTLKNFVSGFGTCALQSKPCRQRMQNAWPKNSDVVNQGGDV